jgi:hypothetical protein
MTLDINSFDVKFKKGKSADQIKAISRTTGLMSGRLIGLHSYKLLVDSKRVETT